MSFRYERAVALIDRAAEKGRLAHAYLLMGPPGSGKEKLACHMIEMANPGGRILPAESLDELRSGRVTVISPESKSRRISIETVRELERALQMAAPAGTTKFAIIREADRLGVEASNAFLKTLEEPPAGSRILLLTSRPEMLLETILSRCIRVPLSGSVLPSSPGAGVETFLNVLADHASKGRAGLSVALGIMSAFSDLLKEEKEAILNLNEEAQKAEVAHYKNKIEGNYLKEREKYWDAIGAAEYLERRNYLVEYLVAWFGDALRQQQGGRHLDLPAFSGATRALADRLPFEALTTRLAAVESLRDHLATNVSESLALEVAFVKAFS